MGCGAENLLGGIAGTGRAGATRPPDTARRQVFVSAL
jgi:hypothetical protein